MHLDFILHLFLLTFLLSCAVYDRKDVAKHHSQDNHDNEIRSMSCCHHEVVQRTKVCFDIVVIGTNQRDRTRLIRLANLFENCRAFELSTVWMTIDYNRGRQFNSILFNSSLILFKEIIHSCVIFLLILLVRDTILD